MRTIVPWAGTCLFGCGLLFAQPGPLQRQKVDPASGAPLWHVKVQANMTNGPITYEIDGVHYLVVAAGDTLYGFAMR